MKIDLVGDAHRRERLRIVCSVLPEGFTASAPKTVNEGAVHGVSFVLIVDPTMNWTAPVFYSALDDARGPFEVAQLERRRADAIAMLRKAAAVEP